MIGPHIIGGISSHRELLQRWRPAAALLLDPSAGAASQFKGWSPETFLIGRVFRADGEISNRIASNPFAAAEWAATIIQNAAQNNREIDVWQFNNEVSHSNPTELARLSEFSIRYVDLLAERGLRAAIGCFSTGTPEAPELDGMAAWNAFLPAMRHGLVRNAVLLLHAYGAPHIFDTGDWLLQRYERKVLPFLPEGVRHMPYVYGEYGCDMGVQQPGLREGWRQGYGGNAAHYVSDLQQAAQALASQPACLGACVFTLGSMGGWGGFEIAGECAERLSTVAWPTPALTPAPVGPPSPVEPFTPQPIHHEPFAPAGAAAPGHGINIDPRNPMGWPSVPELQELGVEWVRLVFKNGSDDQLASDFTFFDSVIRPYRQAGIGVLLVLNNESCPGKPLMEEHGNNEDAWQRLPVWRGYLDKFRTRCRQIAQHYGSDVAYQIWNEPDHHSENQHYRPTLRPLIYGVMLREVYAAIKEVSSATVITGGLMSGDPGYVSRVMAAAGNTLPADAVAVHPYGQRPSPDWPHSHWGFGNLTELIARYHTAAGKPVWITEIGTNDLAVQPEFPQRAFAALQQHAASTVPVTIWFCWSDGMVPSFGLVDGAGAKKSAYFSFQSSASERAAQPVAIPSFAPEWRMLDRFHPRGVEIRTDGDARSVAGSRRNLDRIANVEPSANTEQDWTFENANEARLLAAAGPPPQEVDLRKPWWQIHDQGTTGSCVGWAVADSLLRWHLVRENRLPHDELLSPRFVWMAAKETDEFTSRPSSFIEKDGTSLKAALDIIRKFGAVTETVLPFLSHKMYPSDQHTFYALASKYKIASYFNVGRNPHQWRYWLANNGPILVRLDIDETWDNASETGGQLAEYKPETGRGGHAAALVGYQNGCFIVRNSWGTGWGDGGYAYATPHYARSAFTEAYGIVL